MINLFICGSLRREEEEEDVPRSRSAGSSPRKVWRKTKDNKNPYSSRGLDKFSALLADLDERRQRIYAQNGSQKVSLVRFVYKDSNDLVPIVVKMKERKEEDTKINQDNKQKDETSNNSESQESSQIINSIAVKEVNKQPGLMGSDDNNKISIKSFVSSNLKYLRRLRRPSYYLPVVVILILVFLAVFGRSAAILCTSIGWYVFPTLKDSSTKKRAIKKKEYVRKLSENRMVHEGLSSPRVGASKVKSPRQHGHGKSSGM
ncbi:hypothetical protein UlMin_035390 [Ulmus minor]